MPLPLRPVCLAAIVCAALVHGAPASGPAQTPSTFAARIAALSEPGGYFDTDNLISNERSYLQVLPALRQRKIQGGAYIGVGPDQNFTYIAALRPSIAFMLDIRRDNLLLHLLLKGLFGLSATRADYLALLFARPMPPAGAKAKEDSIQQLVARIDRTPVDRRSLSTLRARVDAAVRAAGVPLSGDDLATIDRFHRRFIDAGLDLQFHSTGRPPQSHYPTYREMLLDTDSERHAGNYLASEASFQFVKRMHARDLIIPVVGNLSGPAAMDAIGRFLNGRGERLSAFYTSNVEFYLFREGSFPQFVRNLGRIPHARDAVVIRSIFRPYSWLGGRPGDGSVSTLQRVDELLQRFHAGQIARYDELLKGSE
jgi:hypothetical protein